MLARIKSSAGERKFARWRPVRAAIEAPCRLRLQIRIAQRRGIGVIEIGVGGNAKSIAAARAASAYSQPGNCRPAPAKRRPALRRKKSLRARPLTGSSASPPGADRDRHSPLRDCAHECQARTKSRRSNEKLKLLMLSPSGLKAHQQREALCTGTACIAARPATSRQCDCSRRSPDRCARAHNRRCGGESRRPPRCRLPSSCRADANQPLVRSQKL